MVGDHMTKKILVVEDEALTSMEIEICLQEWGYSSVTAFSGEEAIKTALMEEPDLILMDIILGGKINGIMAAEEITKQIKVPILFLSAYTDEIISKNKLSPDLYCNLISKPFNSQLLKMAIEEGLSHLISKSIT